MIRVVNIEAQENLSGFRRIRVDRLGTAGDASPVAGFGLVGDIGFGAETVGKDDCGEVA